MFLLRVSDNGLTFVHDKYLDSGSDEIFPINRFDFQLDTENFSKFLPAGFHLPVSSSREVEIKLRCQDLSILLNSKEQVIHK